MSEQAPVFLAVDLGASSGRVIAAEFQDGTLSLHEQARFPTPCSERDGALHWDYEAIQASIATALKSALQSYGERVVSIGVDTWGVDYGLVDAEGRLLDDPIAYRDKRTDGLMDELGQRLGQDAIYGETGIQFMFFNTLYQLYAEHLQKRSAFVQASRLLFLPDLINYWLTSKMATERTMASTSQMLDPATGDWSPLLLQTVGLRSEFLGEVVEPGTVLGKLREEFPAPNGRQPDVVTVAGHDTGSAFLAAPGLDAGLAVLVSGTWSIMGLELDSPQLSEDAREADFSNEIGAYGTVRFLKNICGMWLLEECRRCWSESGRETDYTSLVVEAEALEPLRRLIDPDASVFEKPGGMPGRIAQFCLDTGQTAPETPSEFARCIFDSLALRYRAVFEQLKPFSPIPLTGIRVIGGGAKNRLLNQLTANAIGMAVYAGPVEATALGNVAAQMIAKGFVKDLPSARDAIARSFPGERYHPENESIWQSAGDRIASFRNDSSKSES